MTEKEIDEGRREGGKLHSDRGNRKRGEGGLAAIRVGRSEGKVAKKVELEREVRKAGGL